MKTYLAVDFGTTEIKVAYYDPEEGNPRVLPLGENGKKSMPTCFYGEKDKIVAVGDAAQEKWRTERHEPGWYHATLKADLAKKRPRNVIMIRPPKGPPVAKVTVEELSRSLFEHIRHRAEEHLRESLPDELELTVTHPVNPRDDYLNILKVGAKDAGFKKVHLYSEPGAAAVAWIAKDGIHQDMKHLIVMDCGGGTTDWVLLKRDGGIWNPLEEDNGEFGGVHVDKALEEYVRDHKVQQPRISRDMRDIKERYCAGESLTEILKSFSKWPSYLQLNDSKIQSAIEKGFIEKLSTQFERFYEKHCSEISDVSVLLVGGSSKLKGVDAAIADIVGSKDQVLTWPDEGDASGIYATACGAAYSPEKKQDHILGKGVEVSREDPTPIPEDPTPIPEDPTPIEKPDHQKKPTMPEENRQHTVAKGLRDMATLIGPETGVEVTIGGQQVTPGLGLIDAAEDLLKRAAELEAGYLRIAVAGGFAGGKSTLINAILGKEVLPADIGSTTAVSTKIVYGTCLDKVTLVHKDGQRTTLGHEKFLETIRLRPEEVTTVGEDFEMPDRLKIYDSAVVESGDSLCKAGLHFIDTAGFKGDKELEDITGRALTEAHAIVAVLAADRRMFNRDDTEFLKHQLDLRGDKHRRDNLFFVINHFKEEVSKEYMTKIMEDIAPKVLRKFALKEDGTVDPEYFNDRLFRVNAKEALASRCAGASDNEVAATGLPALVERLRHVIFKERLPLVLDAIMKQTVEPVRREAPSKIHSTKEKRLADAHVRAKESEAAQRESEEKLQALHQRAHDIRKTSDSFIKNFGGRVASLFEDTLKEILSEWENDWETYGLGDYVLALATPDLKTAAGQKAAKEAMVERIASHFEQKFGEKITPESSQRIFTEEVGELKKKVASFGEKLAEFRPKKITEDWEEWSERIFSLVFEQDSDTDVTRILAMAESLVRTIIIGVVVALVSTIVGVVVSIIMGVVFNPFFLTGLLPFVLLVIVGPSWAKMFALRRVRDRLHKGLRENLQSVIPSIKETTCRKTREELQPPLDKLHRILQENIEEAEEELHCATERKSAKKAEVDAEIKNLEKIETCLTTLFEAIHCEIYPGVPPAVVKEETKN